MTAAMGPKVKGDAAAVAPAPVSDAERRVAPRVLVDLEVDYASEENYLFAYITDISATGIFVWTTTPEAPGTHLNLRFLTRQSIDATAAGSQSIPILPVSAQDSFGDLPENAPEAMRHIEVEGEVIWVNP
jgi:hypothetical protein